MGKWKEFRATTKAWKHHCIAVTTNNIPTVREQYPSPNVFNAIGGVYTTNWSQRVTERTSPYSNEEKGKDSLAELQNSRVY